MSDRIMMKPNARVQSLIYNLFHRYTRTSSNNNQQKVFDEVINHFHNRYRYTWIVFEYARHHRKSLKFDILTKNGIRSQDQKSKQGPDVNAAHVARFCVNPVLQEEDPELCRFILQLLSVTENVPVSFNQGGIAHDIDKISYKMLDHDNAEMKLKTWTTWFLDVLAKHFLIDQISKQKNPKPIAAGSSISSVAHYTTDLINDKEGSEDFEKLLSGLVNDLKTIWESYDKERQM